MPKCPHCSKSTDSYVVREVDLVSETPGYKAPGLEISCPECKNVLSVSWELEFIAEEIARILKKQ